MMKKNCKVCGEEFYQPKKHYYIDVSSELKDWKKLEGYEERAIGEKRKEGLL
jgi:hypothetical protein